MELFNFRKMTLGMKIIYGLVAVGIVAAIIAIIAFNRSSYLATTMRLLRTEGNVKIEAAGKSQVATKNKRFQSGEAIWTGADGLASVGLDDTKIVTLQSDSRAEFVKKNKQLELKLTKGAVFFEVTQKLNQDETFEIKTSTLTAGIRGTSGYIYFDAEGKDSLTVTDGKVIVTAVNPDTGERKYAEVSGGQRITVHLYSDRTSDSVEFEIEDLTESDLDDFLLKMLVENDSLLDKVCQETGWVKTRLQELAREILNKQIEGSEVTTTTTTEESTEESTEPADTTESETETTTEETTTSSETSGTTKAKATNTPKPKDTNNNNNNHKATNTPKPKKNTNTPKPTESKQTETEPTQGSSSNNSGSSSGGNDNPGGGGNDNPGGGGGSSSGGGSDNPGGGGSSSGGGGSSSGGGGSSGGDNGGGNSNPSNEGD